MLQIEVDIENDDILTNIILFPPLNHKVPPILSAHFSKILPEYMSTPEWKIAIDTIISLWKSLNPTDSSLVPKENTARYWLPVNLALIWSSYKCKYSLEMRRRKYYDMHYDDADEDSNVAKDLSSQGRGIHSSSGYDGMDLYKDSESSYGHDNISLYDHRSPECLPPRDSYRFARFANCAYGALVLVALGVEPPPPLRELILMSTEQRDISMITKRMCIPRSHVINYSLNNNGGGSRRRGSVISHLLGKGGAHRATDGFHAYPCHSSSPFNNNNTVHGRGCFNDLKKTIRGREGRGGMEEPPAAAAVPAANRSSTAAAFSSKTNVRRTYYGSTPFGVVLSCYCCFNSHWCSQINIDGMNRRASMPY